MDAEMTIAIIFPMRSCGQRLISAVKAGEEMVPVVLLGTSGKCDARTMVLRANDRPPARDYGRSCPLCECRFDRARLRISGKKG